MGLSRDLLDLVIVGAGPAGIALGGAPPENTLRTLGIDFDGQPAARDGSGISVPGFFLVGDLATGRAILGQVAPRVRLAAS